MNTSLALYRHARKDLGLSEVPGPKSNPRIAYAIKTAASWLPEGVKDVDGSIAWCGCIMGLWCLELGLGVPKAHFRAINWLNWGDAVDLADAKRGDVVVISRPGGNHVTLFEDIATASKWKCFGGNQSNTVNSSTYARSLVKGVRRAA